MRSMQLFKSFETLVKSFVFESDGFKKRNQVTTHLLSLEWSEVCEWIGLFVDVDRRQMSSSDETAFDFSLSLSLCFPLSFSLFLNSAISVCLSVYLALLSVCLSLFLCLSLSSNLRLDLLNPHTVRLTYTIIRIKTRWWDWRHLIIWANSLVNCYFSLKVTKLDDLQFRFTILYNISILLSLRSLRMNCFIRARIPSSLEWKLNVVCLI